MLEPKRSLLPFGGLFNFLFGTANDDDVKSMKQDIQKLYDNQVSQSKVLNDVISIANISRGIINQLKPLFTARISFYCTWNH